MAVAATGCDVSTWLSQAGLQEAVLSVFDLERVAAALGDSAGFRRLDLPDVAAGSSLPMHWPAGCTRVEQCLLLPPGDAKAPMGCLRLQRFHGLPQRLMRSSQRSWDTGGIFDVDVYVRDVDAFYRRLQRHGWTAFGEPVEYREAEFHVRQVVAIGPDGLVVAAIQRYSPPVPALDAAVAAGRVIDATPIFNSTQMVRDFDRSADFYERALGWQKSHDFVIDAAAEPGAEVLGLPLPYARTARRRIGIFRAPDAAEGSIELIENSSMVGRDCAADCVAPNVGLLSLRFRVPDAERYAAELRLRDVPILGAPQRMELAPYGAAIAFTVRAPEGAQIEFLTPL